MESPQESNKASLILSCLDLTDMDEKIIGFTRTLRRFYAETRTLFLHVIQEYDMEESGSISREFSDGELEDAIKGELLEKIRGVLPGVQDDELILRRAEEDAAKEVTEAASEFGATVLVIGEKEGKERSHWYTRHITARAPCHVAIVSELLQDEEVPRTRGAEEWEIKTILYATDFSKKVDPGLEFSLQLARTLGAKLGLHYVHDTSKSFFPSLRPKGGQEAEDKSRKEVKKALDRIDAGGEEVSFITTREDVEYDNEAQRLYAAAEYNDVDLIIFSSEGKRETVTSLYGQIVEYLGKLPKEIPLFYYCIDQD